MASQQWSEPADPAGGQAVMHRHEDGTVTVEHADNVIDVTPELLDQLEPPHLEPDGTLVLDTAGEYRYQRVGERADQGRRVLVYRRVQRAP